MMADSETTTVATPAEEVGAGLALLFAHLSGGEASIGEVCVGKLNGCAWGSANSASCSRQGDDVTKSGRARKQFAVRLAIRRLKGCNEFKGKAGKGRHEKEGRVEVSGKPQEKETWTKLNTPQINALPNLRGYQESDLGAAINTWGPAPTPPKM
jgi:hypothetical protein